MSSDLTFITNEKGRSLLDRFNALLKEDTHLFDCLVGFFFVSGFYKLYPSLEKTKKIRVLIGLQTNRETYDLIQKAKDQEELDLRSHAETKAQLPGEILSELEKSEDKQVVEEGVGKFIDWIKSKKLEIKAYPTEKIHAKLYIMTFHEDDRDKGRVITGSSNFSQAGFIDNLELNVELKNRTDYDFAIAKFNELWANAVDVSETYVQTIEEQSPFAHFTPYELYLKFLYEYFRGELNRPDELDVVYRPTQFKKLRYQDEAVLGAKKVLEEYGGVFLSDVVGLGKTYMAAMLAQEIDGRTLVLAPPALLDKNNPGSWINVFGDFKVHAEFESIGKLDDLLKRDTSKYKNVVVDESHRFRTETTQTYEKLAQICRGKRVILVTATPLNNFPRDILSQIKLFQPGKNSTIPNVRDLEAFFMSLERNLKGLDRQHDRAEYFRRIQANAKEIREKVLKYLMIRRTRSEIVKYYGKDLKLQDLKFPDVADPEAIFYKFNKQENAVFNETISLLGTGFTYARYKPLTYAKDPSKFETQLQAEVNLAKFMKILLVKRLESSFFAFQHTLERFLRSYEQVIKQYHKGQVYISKDYINKIFEWLDTDNHEAIERLINEGEADRYEAKDFKAEFIRDLESDHKTLKHIHALWAKIKRDPKWESFREILSSKKLKTSKLIIFTESKETAAYLSERIAKEVERKVILYSGDHDEATRELVITNFDARAFRPKDDYRILVTTDVFSEGVNLHRSNTVINYDIPWNPTRMIQRVGRVNRVDTKFDAIYTYNFFPSEEGNDLMKLTEAAESKIQAFIEMLGADARLLTEGEEIKSHDLFVRLTSKKTVTGEDEKEESELEYLTEIREVRDKDPDMFERIKRLPKKARASRTLAKTTSAAPLFGGSKPALLTYFRKGKLDKFFVTSGQKPDAHELDFLTTAKILRAEKAEKSAKLSPDFYSLLDKNKAAFARVTTEEMQSGSSGHGSRTNEAYILKRLKTSEIRRCKTFTEDDEDFVCEVIRLLEEGLIPKPTSRRVADALKKEINPLKVLGILRRDIPSDFFQQMPTQSSRTTSGVREVILSEIFVIK